MVEIAGEADSLKSRFMLYMCNSLIENNMFTCWISSGKLDNALIDLEVKNKQNMTILLENDLSSIELAIQELPDDSYVFIDALSSIVVNTYTLKQKPYLNIGKVLYRLVQEKNLKLYFSTVLNGITRKPVSDIFSGYIGYRIRIVRKLSKKDFVGLHYSPVGYYYSVTINGFEQKLYASIFSKIDPLVFKFYWLVASKVIKKIKRTYYLDNKKLGSDVSHILEEYSDILKNQ